MDLKESVALDPRLHVPDPVSASGESGDEVVPPSAQIRHDSDSEEECSYADCHISLTTALIFQILNIGLTGPMKHFLMICMLN